MTNPRIIVDQVEYFTRDGEGYTVKEAQEYFGVEERKSDGITCLSLRTMGATRRHNIEVGNVIALTIRGRRWVVETPSRRWRQKAQEIARLIEGSTELNARSDDHTLAMYEANEITVKIINPSQHRAQIKYVDSWGQKSTRIIVPRNVVIYFNLASKRIVILEVIAFCEKANEERTFAIDRIEYVTHLSSGEIKDAEGWLGSLPWEDLSETQIDNLNGHSILTHLTAELNRKIALQQAAKANKRAAVSAIAIAFGILAVLATIVFFVLR